MRVLYLIHVCLCTTLYCLHYYIIINVLLYPNVPYIPYAMHHNMNKVMKQEINQNTVKITCHFFLVKPHSCQIVRQLKGMAPRDPNVGPCGIWRYMQKALWPP